MSKISKYIKRLARHDTTLKRIALYNNHKTDTDLAELIKCLLTRPDVVKAIWLGCNRLTDKTGVKLSKYVTVSSNVVSLSLFNNQLGEATYLALAAALRVNSSLQFLCLFDNPPVDQKRIDAMFIDALRLNPIRPVKSEWLLFSSCYSDIDFKRLKDAAEKSTPPSMLEFLLCMHLDKEKIEPHESHIKIREAI